MTSDKHRKSPSKTSKTSKKDAGPQGTMIFSASEVEAALDEKTKIKILAGADDSMLVGINAPFDGQVFHLTKHNQTIGRKTEQDIVLDDPSISSLHAQITKEDDNWKIINLLSSNGTFVNGKKVSISPLKDGDKVNFGQAEFIFKSSGKHEETPQNKERPSKTIWLGILAIVIIGIVAASFYW